MNGMSKLILAKQKLGRSLLSKARQLQRPEYLPFITPERRRARIYCLRTEGKRQLQEAEKLQSRKGPCGPKIIL